MVKKVPKETLHEYSECTKTILPVRDALDILSGNGNCLLLFHFHLGISALKQMAHEIPGITDKMLSKELRDLETNQLVKRTVYDAMPVVVEYSMTSYGKTLEKVINELRSWGIQHRKRMIGKVKQD